jgi:hypothetical protein
MHERIKCRLNSENVSYHLVWDLLSSHLLSNNINIEIYGIEMLPVFLYGRETWSVTLREEQRSRRGC